MNTMHTPGPWHTDIPDPAFVNYEVRTNGTIICTMGIDMPPEEEEANARLIAAAPELLAELEKCANVISHSLSELPDAYRKAAKAQADAARAAIAKATQP